MEDPGLLSQVSQGQLVPILEAAAGVPIATVADSMPRDVGGGFSGGRTHLYTFVYTTREGVSGEVTLFVKRCAWKQRRESVHYQHLAANGVPTPRLFGALPDDRGEEIIFLEPLTATDFRHDSEEDWRRMLSLLARLNACVITPDYAPHLHQCEQIGIIDGGLWISGMLTSPTNDKMAASLRACDVADSGLPAILHAAWALHAQVAQQPKGLLYQDFVPGNFGWRGEREELVVFDLHKSALGPRFADTAPYLGSPDWSDSAAFLDMVSEGVVSRRERLIQHYLDEYARFGGPTVSPETFREETAALSWSHKVEQSITDLHGELTSVEAEIERESP